MVKRKGGLMEQLCTIDNINTADDNARLAKRANYKYIADHDENRDLENQILLDDLENLMYKTSDYKVFKIYEPKERLIYKLPYYPDRIAHHAIMNVAKDIWDKQFIPNTYSCIKDRGIHKLLKDLKRDLWKTRYNGRTEYCLKLDITKFYPSINHEVLKEILARKIKDKRFLTILFEIVDSTEQGVPIGNYLSQYFANLYLSEFDRWCKSELKCRFYYRYADDIVILSNSKDFLRTVLICIKLYLRHKLKLSIKGNYQIFPVESRGIDFVGYVFRHEYIRLRKSIKNKLLKQVREFKKPNSNKEKIYRSIVSYFGWCKHANTKHLLSKIEEQTKLRYSNFVGKFDKISNYYGKTVKVVHISPHRKYYNIEFIYKGKPIVVKSKNIRQFKYLSQAKLPVIFKFVKHEKRNKNNK